MRKALKRLLVAAVIAACAAAGLGMYVIEQLKPPESGVEVVFTVEPGMTSGEIAHLLEENGMIRSALIFSNYLKYKNLGTGFQAGTYAMSPGIGIQEIIQKLNNGETVKEETIRITVPEGYTLRQLIGDLTELGFPKEQLTALANDPKRFSEDSGGASSLRAKEIPEGDTYFFALEGYLFPETYEFPKDVTADEIFARMVRELDRKLAQLPDDWEAQMDKLGVGFHGIMTIASLVEREVVADHERPLVAGVIYNRLAQKMPLQIDATVQYLFDEPKERLFEKDLKTESPYNTYLNPGLPPGPIASPGLDSIQAALYPEASDYFFYVTKKDGTGEHYFAKTYNEHLQNIRKSNSNG